MVKLMHCERKYHQLKPKVVSDFSQRATLGGDLRESEEGSHVEK